MLTGLFAASQRVSAKPKFLPHPPKAVCAAVVTSKAASFVSSALWLRLETPALSNRKALAWVGLSYVELLPPAPSVPFLRAPEILDFGFFFPETPASPFFTPPRSSIELAPALTYSREDAFLGRASRRALGEVTPAAGVPSLGFAWTDAEPGEAVGYPALPAPRRRVLSRKPTLGPTFKTTASLRRKLLPQHPPTLLSRNAPSPAPSFIPQVRFKPGLRAQWRQLRFEYARLVGIRAERQRRITRYVTLTRTVTGFRFIQALSLSAGFVVKQSGLCCNALANARRGWQGAWEGGWHLNFLPLVNPFIQVYPGDFLTAPASLTSLGFQSHHFYRTQSQRLRAVGLAWFFQLRPSAPAPWYLEVDELTRSVTLLATPSALRDFDPQLWQSFPFLTQRMLNWKYKH